MSQPLVLILLLITDCRLYQVDQGLEAVLLLREVRMFDGNTDSAWRQGFRSLSFDRFCREEEIIPLLFRELFIHLQFVLDIWVKSFVVVVADAMCH